jgi:hypothetical protein
MATEEKLRVPQHIEEAVATIAALHAAHHREAQALQKAVSKATSGIARPMTPILTTVAIASWLTLNLALPKFEHTRRLTRFHFRCWPRSFRPSPFILRR